MLARKYKLPNLSWRGTWPWAQLALLIFPVFPALGAVSLSLLALVTCWRAYRQIVRSPVNWALGVLSLWLIVTSSFAFKPSDAFLGLANLLPFFIIFAAFSVLIQTPAQLRRLAWILVIPSLPVVILGFGQVFLGWATPAFWQNVSGWVLEAYGNPPGRMASVFMYTNILAAYLQIVLILGLGLWIETFQAWQQGGHRLQDKQLLFLSVMVLGNAIALFLTSSRNAWGIAGLACLAFALYLGWRWIVLAVTAAASTILWASFGPEFGRPWVRRLVPAFFWARLSDQMYPNRPVATLRTTLWQFAWNMTLERPWIGWGLRNFTPLYEAKMHLWRGHPHSLLLMLLAETGIPATLLFCGVIGWILAQGILLLRDWQDITSLKDGTQWHPDQLIFFTYLIAFGGCVLFNLADVTLFDLRVNTLGWLLLSAICGVVYRYQDTLRLNRLEKSTNCD
ncbi:MAG TPA: O-antigen ligase family protein [Allocoleopsis sp.]